MLYSTWQRNLFSAGAHNLQPTHGWLKTGCGGDLFHRLINAPLNLLSELMNEFARGRSASLTRTVSNLASWHRLKR